MDVASETLHLLTGHDKNLTLSKADKLQKIWQKRPDPNRKQVADHLRVMIDPYGSIAVTSQTDKQLLLFEVETGKLLCKV